MNTEEQLPRGMDNAERDYFYRLNHPMYLDVGDEAKRTPESSETPPVELKCIDPDPVENPVIEESANEAGSTAAVDLGIAESESREKRKSRLVAMVAALVCVIFISAGALIWLGVLGGSSGGGKSSGSQAASFAVGVGERVPSFRGYVLDPEGQGGTVSDVDLLGKRVVVLAWRGNQPESLDYLRMVTQIRTRFAKLGDRITFLGISLDEDQETALDAVVATNAYEWPHLFDWDADNAAAGRPSVKLGIVETPALYVFDPLLRLSSRGLTPSSLAEQLEPR